MNGSEEKQGPLAGIRVIDTTSVISGPGAMGILCDQGAEVIKVESPGGDIMRARGDTPGMTPGFITCNRGKRSLAIDLKQDRAKEILWRLIEGADVFAQNFRPGVAERLGFDAGEALARNPGLIYLSINGVGESGPYAGKRVYDPVVQALSGLTDIQADPETGRPRMIRTLVADKTTAIYAAQAVCSALVARARTGRGQHVRLSMLDTMVSFIWPEGMAGHTRVDDPRPDALASAHDMIFPTRDGWVTIGALSDREWQALCKAIDRPELIEDPRFATPAGRARNRQVRMEEVEASLGDKDSATLLAELEAADVPCAPVLSRREMLSDPQVAANGLIQEIEQPDFGLVRQPRAAARFQETPVGPVPTAPALGEDSESVLRELGLDADEIATLRADGVIR